MAVRVPPCPAMKPPAQGLKKTRRRLVVDSLVMGKIVERCLRQVGFELVGILEADSGAEVLPVAQNSVQDLIPTDEELPWPASWFLWRARALSRLLKKGQGLSS